MPDCKPLARFYKSPPAGSIHLSYYLCLPSNLDAGLAVEFVHDTARYQKGTILRQMDFFFWGGCAGGWAGFCWF